MRGEPPGDADLIAQLRGLADSFAGLRPEGLGRRRQAEIHNRGRQLQSELAGFAVDPAALRGLKAPLAASPGRRGNRTHILPFTSCSNGRPMACVMAGGGG